MPVHVQRGPSTLRVMTTFPGDTPVLYSSSRRPSSRLTLHWALYHCDDLGHDAITPCQQARLVGKFGTLREMAAFLGVGLTTVFKLAHGRLSHRSGQSRHVRHFRVVRLRVGERVQISYDACCASQIGAVALGHWHPLL